jgi:hypothetical protein
VSVYLFVDETKARSYLMVAVACVQAELQISRKELRELVLPGQRGLHMNDERDSRRRAIADTITAMSDRGIQAFIYDAGMRYRTERDRRAKCLEALVADAVHYDQARITIDLDESLHNFDRQHMIEYVRAAGAKDRVTYEHLSRSTELLLAIPDAIAWCWARGGEWRRRVGPVVRQVHQV